MSALTDFFIATEAELRAAFPHRYPVAARPKTRKVKNPFTGEPITVREWGPAEPFPADRKPVPLPDRAEIRAVGRLPRAEFKRVDNTKVATLFCLLTGAAFSAVIGDCCRPSLVAPNDDESSLFRLPADWVEAVAGIAKVPPVAKKWAATEECQVDGFTVADTTEVIEALRDLARRAVAEKKGMFLWLIV